MLKVSQKQRKSMADRLSEDLPDEILATLRERLKEHVQRRKPDLGRDDVVAWITSAQKYGIVNRVGLTQFSVLCLLAGENFHRDPDINRYLTMTRMTGDQKMKLLVNMINATAEKSDK